MARGCAKAVERGPVAVCAVALSILHHVFHTNFEVWQTRTSVHSNLYVSHSN